MINMLKHTHQMEQYLIESCSARALAVTLEKKYYYCLICKRVYSDNLISQVNNILRTCIVHYQMNSITLGYVNY